MIETIKKYLEKSFPFIDESKHEEFAVKFLASLKSDIKSLEEALNSNEKNEILKLSHKIKGILLNGGLEDLAKDFNEEKLKKLSLEEIKEKLSSSIKNISSLL